MVDSSPTQVSLNLTTGSIGGIAMLLELEVAPSLAASMQTVLWIGCGNAPEVITLACQHPSVRFFAIETNQAAVEVRTVAMLPLKWPSLPMTFGCAPYTSTGGSEAH